MAARTRRRRSATATVVARGRTRLAASTAPAALQRRLSSSRAVAVVGCDGVGKSKVCAALLELTAPGAPPPASPSFADKSRLLEAESAEQRRNFTCYNHFYSQTARSEEYQPQIHLIDTPGHVDRLQHVDEALRMAHGTAVICSVRNAGVGAASDGIFSAVEKSGKAMVVFLNGIDTADEVADFEAAVDSLEMRLGTRPVVLFAPVHASGTKTGSLLLNVLDGTVCSALGCSLGLEDPGAGSAQELPEKLASWAQGLREQALDALSAEDEELMEAYVEFEGKVSRDAIHAALLRAAAAGRIVPLVAGSAKTGLGIDALEEVIRTFIPEEGGDKIMQELAVSPVNGVKGNEEEPFLGWVFGRRQDGEHSALHVRVLSGSLKPGQQLKALGGQEARGETCKAVEIMMHGPKSKLQNVAVAGPGDLLVVKVPSRQLHSGQMDFLLADIHRDLGKQEYPAAGHAGALEARQRCCSWSLQLGSLDKKERERLLKALHTIREDDDSLQLEENPETGVTILKCMGMLHLQLLRERLAEAFKILNLPLGQPFVEYHATLRDLATAVGQHEVEGKTRIRKGVEHKKANKVDAWAKIELRPSRPGAGVNVECCTDAQQDALDRGVRRGLQTGGPGGIPVVDVQARVLEAEANTAEAAAEAAASAVRKAMQDVGPRVVLLEPIVEMEVDVPNSARSSVLADLEGRRDGIVQEPDVDAEERVIRAEVPLREIRGYSNDLRKLTDGAGFYTFHLHTYREVVPQVEKHIREEELA